MTDIAGLGRLLWEMRATAARPTFVIGVTGPVAVGKSTLSGALAAYLAEASGGNQCDIVGTDGFLFDNQTLAAAGLTLRKGFPESYDVARLDLALRRVREGEAAFPGYSHTLYDIDPALLRRLSRPPLLIVEGLGFTALTPVDALVYVDAAEADMEAWFVRRFMALWKAGRSDPTSFYARFAHLGADAARDLALTVWRDINLPNWRTHIAPLREIADFVVRKGGDHRIDSVMDRRRGKQPRG